MKTHAKRLNAFDTWSAGYYIKSHGFRIPDT